jgi:hypothetical protein
MTELRSLRSDVEAAFQDATAPKSAPRLAPSSGADAPAEPLGPAAQKLADLRGSLAADADALEREAKELASFRLADALRAEQELDAARVQVLDRLSADRRDAAFGVEREGIDQLRWEIWRIGARARFYGLRRDSIGGAIREALWDPFVLTALVLRGGLALAGIGAAFYLNRRRQRLVDGAFSTITTVVRWPRVVRVLDRARAPLFSLSGALLFLAAVWALHRALGPTVARVHEVELAYSLLLWYGLYRLTLTAVHSWIVRRSDAPEAPLSEATSGKILRSLQAVGRYALGVSLLLLLSEVTVGKGFIHHALVRLAWLGAIPLGLSLLRAWRGDICDAYLRLHDTGLLAEAIKRTRHRWYGFFVAVAAFLLLVLSRAGQAVSRYVLSFEDAHRVLAFIFRKRLERRASAASSSALSAGLPEELLAHLPEEPLRDPEKGLDHYPGLDRLETLLTTWRGSRGIGALLLVGGPGSGKTTWLAAAERKAGEIPIYRVPLKRRLLTEADVVEALGAALDAPREARAGARALAAWLRAEPRRLVVLDDLEHLFLRGLDTWGAWEAFLDIVEHSAPSAFWLCALAHHPYRYLTFARGGATVFREIVHLSPWSEQKLAEFLHARTVSRGYEVSFEDLLLDEVDASEKKARMRSTERDFNRLLWDYSQGCPRVALYYWLRSLVPDGERRLKVRLFHGPSEDDLEALGELERFVLASVVWHDSITTEEASCSLCFPMHPCEDALSKLVELGVIDDLGGRHRVTTRWQSAVLRYLVRKHLLQP